MSVSTPAGIADHPVENQYHHDFTDSLLDKDRAPLDEMPAGTFSSSNVHSAIYDFGTQELFIRYLRQTGADAIYQYQNVGAGVWNGLVQASSKGSYVNANIAYDFLYAKVGRDELADVAEQSLGQGRVYRFVTMP